jgi:OmpA-OmpF porin, OOP family
MFRDGKFILLLTFYCISCAQTPPRQQVQATTVPQGVDLDRDGIVDSLDLCAQSIIGEPVDLEGCQPFHFKSVAKVYFEFDQDRLDKEAQNRLDAVAERVLHNRHVKKLIILGYTDSIGSVSYNDELADRRVASVQKYLLAKQIPEVQLEAAYAGSENGGLGERVAVDENWTRLGRARNRHVELILVERVWQK